MTKKIFVTKSSMPSLDEYVEEIKELWNTHWLTNMGTLHKKLEYKLKDYLKVKEISLMVNGHMSLELAISAMKFPTGSEVITTPFTFISTTHAIVRNGLKPVFCDIKPNDYTIDEDKIEELITEKTVAILPVHVYGRVCAIEKIQIIAEKYNLKVIYDAAHAFGVTYKGIGIGNYGNVSVFSFHATKVFNSIEGGAVTFNNPELINTLYNLKNFGIRSEDVVAEVGANAKMNEFAAAMGICNLRHLDENINKRKQIVKKYRELLYGVKGIYYLHDQSDVTWNYSYFPILINEVEFGKNRNDIYMLLQKNNIFSRKYFYPLTSDQACFKNRYKNASIENARYISNSILVLPLYPDLELCEVEKIINIILKGKK